MCSGDDSSSSDSNNENNYGVGNPTSLSNYNHDDPVSNVFSHDALAEFGDLGNWSEGSWTGPDYSGERQSKAAADKINAQLAKESETQKNLTGKTGISARTFGQDINGNFVSGIFIDLGLVSNPKSSQYFTDNSRAANSGGEPAESGISSASIGERPTDPKAANTSIANIKKAAMKDYLGGGIKQKQASELSEAERGSAYKEQMGKKDKLGRRDILGGRDYLGGGILG